MNYEIHVCPKCGAQLPNSGFFFCHVDDEIVKAKAVDVLTEEQLTGDKARRAAATVWDRARAAKLENSDIAGDALAAAFVAAFGDDQPSKGGSDAS